MIFQAHTNAIEAVIRQGVIDYDAVRSYYEQSVQSNRIEAARQMFDRLQANFPNDRDIQSLNIALCLQEQDYIAAMAKIESMAASAMPDSGLIDAGLAVREKIGPMTLRDTVNMPNSVSLCMIAKNEMAGIGACLHWAKPLVNEIILVDTGSTDRTKDIAKLFGARTYDFMWCDDFAEARNFSLEQAKGRWILILDADEMIASSDQSLFADLLEKQDQNPKAFVIETRNYTHAANTINWHANDGTYPQHEAGLGWHPSRKVRLFPNIKTIRFQHPVHEQVEASLKKHNIPMMDCTIPVHHYGELNETKRQKKAHAYFKMGYAKLEKVGNDFQALKELAAQAGQIGQWNEAIELWGRLLMIRPDYAEAYVNLSSANWQKGKYADALKMAEAAIKLNPSLREAHYNYAISQLFVGNALDAMERLEQLTHEYPDYMSADFMLAVSLACSGDKFKSHQIFQELQQTKLSDSVEAAVQETITRFEDHGMKNFADALKGAFRYKPSVIQSVAKTFVVGGNFRGGTTAVAKILKTAGVPMGGNDDGNIEEKAFQHADPEKIINLAKERDGLHQVWGWKFPAVFFQLPQAIEYLRNPHVILVLRDPFAVADSERRRAKQNFDEMLERTCEFNRTMVLFYKQFRERFPVLLISYEHLMLRTESTVKRIVEFTGLNADIKCLIKTVKPFEDAYSYHYKQM